MWWCYWHLTKLCLTFSMISSKLLKWCVLQPSARSTSSWVASFRTWWSLSSGMWASWEITTKFISSSCKRTDLNKPWHFAVSCSISMLKRQIITNKRTLIFWYQACSSTNCLVPWSFLFHPFQYFCMPSLQIFMTFVELGFNALVFVYPTDLIAQAQTDCWQGISRAWFFERDRKHATASCFHKSWRNPRSISAPSCPLTLLWHSGYIPRSWRHPQSSSVTPLSDSFHLGLQLNCKHQDKSICSHQIISRPHIFTKLLNKLCISHVDFPFFQNKMYIDLVTLKQGSKYTTSYVLKTQQLPLQVAHTCIQLRTIKRQALLQAP